MKKPSDEEPDPQEALRAQILGLGAGSMRKTYFPLLRTRLAELERFRAALDGSNDAVLLLEADRWLIQDVNQAACRLLCRTREELLGQDICAVMPSLAEPIQRAAREGGLRDGFRRSLTTTVGAAGPAEVPIEVTLSVVHVDHDAYFIAVARDISERRRAEREREMLLESERAARAEAQRLSHMKDDFVAVVSHELRTPLCVILGWTRMARAPGAPPEQVARGLEVIERNAQLLEQLVGDLLDVSRIAAGKLHVAHAAVDLPALVRLSLDGLRDAAAAKGLALRERLDPGCGPLLGDAGRLQQVVTNLLDNAVKFTPPGGLVEVELTRADDRGVLVVRDTGQGIDRSFLPLLFDRFRQADASMARHQGGLGLGLSIVKSVVEAHGGSVSVDSPGLGRGTCVTVSLPLAHLQVAPAEAVEDDVSLDGVRVLLVEDEPDARELLARLLEESRAEVCAVSTALEALDALAGRPVDVLVSDIGLPGMDGCEMLRRLRRGETPGLAALVPAVALTAFAGQDARSRILDAGFQEHVAKPFEPARLLSIVAALAKSSGLRRRPAGT